MTIVNLSLEPEHIPTLAQWHQAEWAHLNPGESLEQRIVRMQAYLSQELLPSTFVYKHLGQLAGSAAIVHSDMTTRPELMPWLASVYVAPAFRRRGIGSCLVRHVMAEARAAGLANLYLFTPDQLSFYSRLGWTVLAEEHYHNHRVTVMGVALSRWQAE